MSRKRALVTGGCGFVGRHFVRRLTEHDYETTIVDNLSTGLHPDDWPAHLNVFKEHSGSVRFINQDFREYARLSEPEFDMILHLAAVVGGRMTIEGDPLAVATDLAIDATFFNWLAKATYKPTKILYFSSSAAYPIKYQTSSLNMPLSEEMIDFEKNIDLPDMTYGWSKLTGEYLAKFAVANHGLNIAIFRPFSGYGEDQDFSYPFPALSVE